MHYVYYCRAHYSMQSLGKGQYRITKETKSSKRSIHSTDSEIYDHMDDTESLRQKEALQSLKRLFYVNTK